MRAVPLVLQLLKATGTDLRLHLNGALVIQRLNSSQPRGHGDVVRAAAQFNDYDTYKS